MEQKQVKAEQYANEPWRFAVSALTLDMQSEHGHRTISYVNGIWYCICDFFCVEGTCSHVMALGKILAPFTIKQPLGNEALEKEQSHE